MLFVLSSHLAPVAAGLLLGAGLVLVAGYDESASSEAYR